MDEDVLASVPLPGWTVFDALFLAARNDHPEAETSGGIGADTPIVRIQMLRKRLLLLLAGALLVSSFSRLSGLGRWNTVSPPDLPPIRQSLSGRPVSLSREGSAPPHRHQKPRLQQASLAQRHPYTPQAPLRLRASESRFAILENIVRDRTSAFPPTHFFLTAAERSATARSGSKEPVWADQLVTAVIIHEPDWDLQSTQLVIDMVAKYPFVREILVWNNALDLAIDGKSLKLPTESLLGFEPPELRVLNAPSSFSPLAPPVHRTLPPSHAKHLACGLANHGICLFLSSSILPIHLDSLYSAYIDSGPSFNQIVSVVNAEDYYRSQLYFFENAEVDLHTGALFPGLATGPASASAHAAPARQPRKDLQETMVRREHSRRFWQQLSTLTPDVIGEADIYFSVWMNTKPSLLVAPSLPFVENTARPSDAEKALQDEHVLDAVRSLYDVLATQDPYVSPDPFPLAPSPPSTDVRATSHDDRCLFITSMTPFTKKAKELAYSARTDIARTPAAARSGGGGLLARLFGKLGAGRSAIVEPEPRLASPRRAGLFDPWTSVGSIGEYEQLWQAPDLVGEDSASRSDIVRFPATKEDFKYSLSWYPAVNGWHPSSGAGAAANATCWTSPSPPLKDDYFGLRFIEPLELDDETELYVLGSKVLGNIVGLGEQDYTAESWEVWTQAASSPSSSEDRYAAGLWTRRKLVKPVQSARFGDSIYWKHAFQISSDTSVAASTEEEEEEEAAEGNIEEAKVLKKRATPGSDEASDDDEGEGLQDIEQRVIKRSVVTNRRKAVLISEAARPAQNRENARIRALKLVSRDRKNQRIKVCGWQVDDWII